MKIGIKWMMSLLLACAVTVPVFAEEAAAETEKPEVLTPEQRREAMQARRETMRAEREAEMLKRFDTDGDGVLSEQERAAGRETMRTEARERRGAGGEDLPARPERPDRPERPLGPEGRPVRPPRPDRPMPRLEAPAP